MTQLPVAPHAKLGGSGAHRWVNCPGSVRLADECEACRDEPNIYKQEGSAAHEIAARALEKGVDPDLWIDTIVEVEDSGEKFLVTITEEMAEAAQVYVDYVSKVAEGSGDRELFVETRFDLAPLNPPGPMYGTADAAVVVRLDKGSVIEVIDFKYGQGVVVEAEQNLQLMMYALGVVVALKLKAQAFKVTIVQPRAQHPDGIIRSYTFDWDELVETKKLLFESARATQQPDAPLNPGSWCGFCPAQAVCPALHEQAQEVAQQEFSALVETEDGENTLPVPEALTQDQLAEVMDKASLIEEWLKAVRNHVRTLTEAGEDLGYKLVPKRGIRRWRDEEEAAEWLVEILGEDAYRQKLRSPYQSEKALKRIDMKLPEEMWAMISSGTNLVPNDDPREALPPPLRAEDEFDVALVDENYTPDKNNAAVDVDDTIEIPVWRVSVPDGKTFEVKASDETDARREARAVLDTDRLPNHTEVVRKSSLLL